MPHGDWSSDVCSSDLQSMNGELPDVQVGFRKGRGTRDQIADICRIIDKTIEFQKSSTSASLSMLKPLTVCITNNCGKFFKRWQYQTTLPVFCETCMQIKKRQLEPDMKQWTGSKLGKESVKAVCCHPSYLTYVQSTPCDMLGWRKHKLESRLMGEITITLDMQMLPCLWQKSKRN